MSVNCPCPLDINCKPRTSTKLTTIGVSIRAIDSSKLHSLLRGSALASCRSSVDTTRVYSIRQVICTVVFKPGATRIKDSPHLRPHHPVGMLRDSKQPGEGNGVHQSIDFTVDNDRERAAATEVGRGKRHSNDRLDPGWRFIVLSEISLLKRKNMLHAERDGPLCPKHYQAVNAMLTLTLP
jgi:hypothetical protein